jgi:hypothetical protein
VFRQGPDRLHQGIADTSRNWKATLSVFKGGAIMLIRVRLFYQYLKLLIFIAVCIALAWSIWRLLS